ncbi:MAG: endonuclease III domain-containing protein [Thermoproteota archaeon]
MELDGTTVIERLKRTIAIDRKSFPPLTVNNAFEILIATILSQNTSDRNTERSMKRLRETIGVTPEKILKASIRDLKSAIRSSGLYNVKARIIKRATRIIFKKYEGRIEPILKKDLEEARMELMSLPGVGPKTAGVILLFAGGKPAFPIDTHVSRVSRRLGIVGEKDGYEEARRRLMEFFSCESYLEAHLLLIEHGRRVCKAKNPMCNECLLLDACRFGQRLLEERKE